jgi:hypothetical protein
MPDSAVVPKLGVDVGRLGRTLEQWSGPTSGLCVRVRWLCISAEPHNCSTPITRRGRLPVGPRTFRRLDDLSAIDGHCAYEFRLPHTPILGPHPTVARLAEATGDATES